MHLRCRVVSGPLENVAMEIIGQRELRALYFPDDRDPNFKKLASMLKGLFVLVKGAPGTKRRKKIQGLVVTAGLREFNTDTKRTTVEVKLTLISCRLCCDPFCSVIFGNCITSKYHIQKWLVYGLVTPRTEPYFHLKYAQSKQANSTRRKYPLNLQTKLSNLPLNRLKIDLLPSQEA